ncbi:transposase family protein [Streptomyces smyrnaeus]|uniref:transposase family protein n=1 Tax=Streptomyces smyrnaeus TaxID=1387713 RepID=UPI0036CF2DE0
MARAASGRARVPATEAGGGRRSIDGTEIRVRRPAAGRKDRDKFIFGKSKQNAVKTMVVTDGDGRTRFCSPAQHGSCADITHAASLGWSSSWRAARQPRSSRTPATRAWEPRPVGACDPSDRPFISSPGRSSLTLLRRSETCRLTSSHAR